MKKSTQAKKSSKTSSSKASSVKAESKPMQTKRAQHADLLEKLPQYGSILFGVGLLIILISSFMNLSNGATEIVVGTLAVLGVILGVLNVTNKEATKFMLSAVVIAMLLGPFMGLLSQYFGNQEFFIKLLSYLTALLVPAAVVVALRTLFVTAKDE
jgi:hypothetical protein